jgi:peptidyl-prolyl cis-trans isomerase SurA
MMQLRVLAVFALVLGAVGAAGTWSARSATRRARGASAPTVVARIGERTLTMDDVPIRLDRLGAATPRQAYEAIKRALDRRIDTELLLGEARARGVTLDDADRAALTRDEPRPELLERAAADEHSSVDAYRRAREDAALAEKLVAREVYAKVELTPADVAAYVAKHREQYRAPDRFRLRAIFVSAPPGQSPERVRAAEERIARAAAALETQRFEAVAQKFSDGIEGASGGALPECARGEPPLDDDALAVAASRLKEGGVSAVLRAKSGFYLLRLDRHIPPADLPLDRVHAQAEAELRRERGAELRDAYLASLRARAHVTVLLPPPDA